MANEPTNTQIGFIGAIGGLSLIALNLVESGFFIDDLWCNTSKAAYLTYIVYIFFGVVVSLIFTERSLTPSKLKKNAFILGLLAPSLLIAIASRPIEIKGSGSNIMKSLTPLGSLIIQPAYAESGCPGGLIEAGNECIEGKEINNKDVGPTFGQAFKAAITRTQVPKKYTFVIGVTKNGLKAEKVAKDINKHILAGTSDGGISAKVVKPEGKGTYYVTVGKLGSPENVLKVKTSVESSAIDALANKDDEATKDSAKLLLKGKIVEGNALLNPKD